VNSALNGEGWSTRPCRLIPGKRPGTLSTGPVWTGAENLVPSLGFNSGTVQPVACRYTDYTTPAQSKYYTNTDLLFRLSRTLSKGGVVSGLDYILVSFSFNLGSVLSLGILLWTRKSVRTEQIAIDVRASMDFASSEATGNEFRAMSVV